LRIIFIQQIVHRYHTVTKEEENHEAP
jgi:hypothetical protein